MQLMGCKCETFILVWPITEDDVYIEQYSVFQPTGTGSYANYSKRFTSISKVDVSDDNLIENESPPSGTLEPGQGNG